MTKQKNGLSSEKIITRRVIWLVLIIVMFFSISLLIGIDHEILEQESRKANNTLTLIERTEIDSPHDWRILRQNNLLNVKTNFVYIYDKTAHGGQKHFYSPQTKSLMNHKLIQVKPFDNIYYSPKFGFLYYVSGSSKGINYHIWRSVKDEISLMNRIIQVSILMLIIFVLISLVYIKITALQLSSPLNQLSNNVEHLIENNKLKTNLKVPQNASVEVEKLTLKFNELLKQLNNQNQREKDFISNATHELKTPIATIKSNVQLIKRRGQQHPEIIAKSFNYIDSEVNLMQDLVDQLLMISRESHLKVSKEMIDLTALVQEIISNTQPMVSQQIRSDIAPDQTIIGDKVMINLIITNILNNAVKYSDASSSIHISLVPFGNKVRLNIADKGIGITPEEKKHIFERFYRSPNVRGNVQGNGLGLSLVSQLSNLNNIQIDIQDNQPHGTIFSLIFERKGF